MLSAMMKASGVQVLDTTQWARGALQAELVKACATDRSEPSPNSDIRVDAIVQRAKLGAGNAAVLAEGAGYLCAYRFDTEITYIVAVSERPESGMGGGKESHFTGDIRAELVSGFT